MPLDRMELLEIAKANAAKALGTASFDLPASLRTVAKGASGAAVSSSSTKMEVGVLKRLLLTDPVTYPWLVYCGQPSWAVIYHHLPRQNKINLNLSSARKSHRDLRDALALVFP